MMTFYCPTFWNMIILYLVSFGAVLGFRVLGAFQDDIIFYLSLGICVGICIIGSSQHKIVFDERIRKVIITKNLFWYPIRKFEIPFKDVTVFLSNDDFIAGRYGPTYWKLNLADKRTGNVEYFIITYSQFKSPLLKKKEKIENFIEIYL